MYWTTACAANTLAMELSAQLLLPQYEVTCCRKYMLPAQQEAVFWYEFVGLEGPYLATEAAFPKP